MDSKNKIPLRQFYKNIDDYIINQASDMAVSYSLYLLNKFPKNVAVYQLLGKAYLDLKEFDNALFLFEKILDIEPDDFISHVGISLISENFGNVDQALTSMLRAYELQPANESLQNEVKRLTEAKDGFAPEKIRLTRGALIKMYTRSKLTEQAIAEAQLGLHESPDRVDYKVHLAKMLQEAGNEPESTEKCMEILFSYPYCKPALEILYKNFVSSGNEEDAGLYKSRISELDPYFAYMNPDTESVNNIPDIAVMVEEIGMPETDIDNVESFLDEVWAKPQAEPKINADGDNTEDWDEIIEEAISNDGIGEPIDDESFDEVLPEMSEDDKILVDDVDPTKNASKIDRFRQRLQLHHNTDAAEDFDDIPEWIRDDVENKDKAIDDSQIEQAHEFEEDGMTDHQTPINPEIESEKFMDSMSDWKASPNAEESAGLDDTQRIKVIKTGPDEIKNQLISALNEKDMPFAFRCIDALIKEKFALKDVAEKLEEYLKENPKNIELLLKLVRIYHELDDKTNAISALEKAQINISI